MSATVNCEGAAERGQILLSHAAAALLDEADLGETTEEGRVLERCPSVEPVPPTELPGGAVEPFVPTWLAEQTAAGDRRRTPHGDRRVRLLRWRRRTARVERAGGGPRTTPGARHGRRDSRLPPRRALARERRVRRRRQDHPHRRGTAIHRAGRGRRRAHRPRELIEIDVGLPTANRTQPRARSTWATSARLDGARSPSWATPSTSLRGSCRSRPPAKWSPVLRCSTSFPPSSNSTPLEPFTVKGKTEPIHAVPRRGAAK